LCHSLHHAATALHNPIIIIQLSAIYFITRPGRGMSITRPSSRHCRFAKYLPFTCNMYSFCGYLYFLWAFHLSSKQVILKLTSLQTNLHAV
jgi:hypothetical protein